MAATGVDALAVAVGSSHAITTRTAVLDDDLIGRLHAAVPVPVPVPLVLPGSSGVGDDNLRRPIDAGMSKINFGTALGAAYTAAVRDTLAIDPGLVDPRVYLAPARGNRDQSRPTAHSTDLNANIVAAGPGVPTRPRSLRNGAPMKAESSSG